MIVLLKSAVLLLAALTVLVMLAAACAQKQSEEMAVLDYKKVIHLDAEDLGEGAVGSVYSRDIVPELQKHVLSPAEITETLVPEEGIYTVTALGKTYVIYSHALDPDADNWGNATVAVFDIVNRQLRDSPYRFYAVNGGNDLGGIFLTESDCVQAVESIDRKEDRPYLPIPNPPWYGMEHDE